MGVGGLVALQSFSTIKRGTRTLDFKSNEPTLKFLRRPLPYEVPLEKIIIKHWSRMAFTIGNAIALPLIRIQVKSLKLGDIKYQN